MDSITELEELEKFSPVSDRRPFEVILRGGKPWGFTLAGGEGQESPLHISKIEEGSRAENSALLTGDIVLSVNGISCGGIRAADQLIDSAFRTLTLKVLRGGWDSSRGVRPLSFQHRASDAQLLPPRARSGSSQWRHVAHDDSALYTQSKASQQSAMKPSRPRRGDSFTVGKTNPLPSPSTSDPPWNRPSTGYTRPGPTSHTAARSSYPDIRDPPRSSVKSDRRYSDAPSRYHQPRDQDRDRDHHMVASRSSPDLNKGEPGSSVPGESVSSPVKPAKSSPDIPKDLDKERPGYGKRPSGYEQQLVKGQSGSHSHGSTGYGYGEDARSGDYFRHKSKRVSEDMYTADMSAFTECKPVSSYSLQKYQPDYENVAYLANAPLQSEKISEIMDIDDSLDSEVSPPPGSGTKEPYSPTLPERDLASLKYMRVNQSHEKYPSWPVTQPNTATDQSQPINTRAQSWTDHTNTSKEFPTKQRLAYQPGLWPLQEKNSPTSEQKGDDTSGKVLRNSSDPGFKTPEFTYDRYGRVVQKRKDDMKGRFEDFYQNSKPGYLPPRFDSDGHSYGDKEYNVPSPPERDVAGVDRHVLSQQALGTEAGEHPSQSYSHHKVPQQSPQPQEPSKQPSQRNTPSSQRMRLPGEGSTQSATASNPAYSPPQLRKRPGALPMSSTQAAKDPRRADMATSPLTSPHGSSASSRVSSSQGVQSPSQRDYMHRDSAARSSNKPYIVRPTPYYNTSTQTDGQSYAVKMSDPHARLCNVEIQVGEGGSQTSPKVEFEEKSIQARMSREFQPSELDSSSPKKLAAKDKRNFFQYPFEGMQSIQAKYSTDMDITASSQPPEMFPQFDSGDQASISIMRKLSEEFYGGNKMGLLGEKRHSSASSQEHSPKPVDSSGMSGHSGTMSQAESYSSVIIHPSESAGPFGRDDFGSQSSITDSRNDLASLASSSRSSLKDSTPRVRNSLEYFPRTATRPLQESRKFNSLSSISHQRERSAPVKSRDSESRIRGQDIYVDTRSHRAGSHRDSTSGSEPSPSQPKSSPDTHSVSNTQTYNKGQLHSDSSQSSSRSALTTSQRAKTESTDAVFIEPSAFDPKDRSSAGKESQTSSYDSGAGQGAKRTGSADILGRKLSMKKAYGIYDDSDRPLPSPKDSRSSASGTLDMGGRTRGSYSDSKQLGQIQEEGDSSVSQSSKELMRHKTEGDISDTRQRLDSWRNDLDKRTGRAQRTSSEHMSSVRGYESSSRPQHLFHASIDSGFGSEISSRADGQMTPSDPSQSGFLSMEKTSGADLKKFQQQAVLNFVQRKTGKSFPSTSMEHSPESSLYESINTPRSPNSPTSETVSDLISKTNETLAKRADSIRRSGSSSSRASSSDYVDMNRPDRSRKETEWSRLRSSGSFQYTGSNRSSLCSENTYEDISVFATPTPRSSTQEAPKDGEGQSRDSQSQLDEGLYRGKMDSGVMASPTYQNFPGASRRRAPPPPPRTPSPEPRTPPALPPRNYLQKEDEGNNSAEQEQANVDEAKIDFKSLFNQWENNSPREDTYAAQLRRQAVKFSGQRGSSSAAPSSMSVIHSRTQMGISMSYKRQPTMAQEATSPTSLMTTSVTSSVSSMSVAENSSSSPHRLSSSDVSQQAGTNSQPSLSPSSQTKESSSSLPVSSERDSKPLTVTITTAVSRPPQLPERTVVPSREDSQVPPRTDTNLPPRGEAYLSRDRSVSEVPNKDSEQSFVSTPTSRERSSSDTRVLAKLENSSMSAVGNGVHSPKQSDLPLPSPPQQDSHDGVIDPAELPPPPPELLNDSVGSFDKSEQQGDEPFADDSYGAFRNRGSRQVGNYQRSASAAASMRPGSQPPKSPTDSQAMFGDHRLGGHNWNSDSQLQSRKRPDTQQGGGTGSGSGVGGCPGSSPDQTGNVPAFKADSGPVRNTVKRFESPQPLAPQSQPQGQTSAGDGKTYTARPYQIPRPLSDCVRDERGVSPEQPRSVKERISNLERKSSFSSASSSSTPTPTTSPMHTANTPTSCSQRWTSATSFQATQRSGGDNVQPQTVNTNSSTSSRVPNLRSMVLTDSHQPRERPHSGSLASPPTQDPSTQTTVNTRPRSYSEHGRQGEMSPPSATEPKRNQRYTEAPPVASDPRALPGHFRNSSQSSVERPRSSSSPYNRRESAPAPHIPPEGVVAMVSPRRKSEGNFLPSPEELQKEMSPPPGPITAGHGRQPSQEELECDLRAKELAKEVADSEKKLSDVLSADASKKRMQYMDGLFSGPKDMEVKTPVSVRRHQSQGSVDASFRQPAQNSDKSPTAAASPAIDHTRKRNSLPKEYFVSPPKAVLEMEWRKKEEVSSDLTKNIHDNEALIRQKEELIEKLLKKLDLLKEERKKLQEEIQEIEELGKRVCEAVDCKCENRSEREKFHTYISDLEKIVRLLLNLSGQLARAENAVQALDEDADPEVKKRTLGKRERLQTKHAEAKQLKEDIDKRSDTVSTFLRQSLSGEELNDYAYFVKMKSKLTIELQELEDKITLGQEQIQELKKSIPERTALPHPESAASTTSSSPAPSPVPSS